MIQRYHEIQCQKAAGERDESGAAVVVFALGGVSSSSQVAACNTDAKTVQTVMMALVATPSMWALSRPRHH
jgi:hypothetical protein